MVDVSLFEPLLRIMESVVVRHDQTGAVKSRLGNQMEEDVPRNIYATADGGHIAISCGSQAIFDRLTEAIGRADLQCDPRYATMAERVANRDAIDADVATWMRAQPTAAALQRLLAHGVVAGRVNDIADVLRDEHVLARDAIVTVADPVLGPMRLPAPVPKLSATPGGVRWTGRRPGADNDRVFGELLGLPADEIAALRQKGVI